MDSLVERKKLGFIQQFDYALAFHTANEFWLCCNMAIARKHDAHKLILAVVVTNSNDAQLNVG